MNKIDKDLFKEMLKKILKDNIKLKLSIDEDSKGAYGTSTIYTFDVKFEIDGKTITSAKDTLHLR